MQVVAGLLLDEFVGSWRRRSGVPAESVVGHRQATDLGNDVLARCDGADVVLPSLEDFVALAFILADPTGCAEVVEDHRGSRNGLGKLEELVVLVVVVPRVVGESALTESVDAGPERLVRVLPSRVHSCNHHRVGFGGPGECIADTAKAPAGRLDVRIEGVVEMCAIGQVDMPDDAGNGRPVRVLRGEPIRAGCDEFGLTDASQVGGAFGAIRSVALHEQRGNDVMAARGIGRELGRTVEQRSADRPQMVVRVHDRSLGIDDRLDDLVEPSLIAFGDRLVGHPSFLVA